MENDVKTTRVAADRAYDSSQTVFPAEVARGSYMQNAPSLAALKLMHLLIATAGGRMGEDVEHRVRLSAVREIDGMKNHDRESLTPLFAELQAAVLISDDVERRKITIGGLLDVAEIDYRDEAGGDLAISWYFSRMFTRAAAQSNHWAIIDRQTVYHLTSRYSILLFQHLSSLTGLKYKASKTFSIPELRALLAIPDDKQKRFADLNRNCLKPAVAEINHLSRFHVQSTTNKIGRRVQSVTIDWTPKDDPGETKRELARPKTGRTARRTGTVETVASATKPIFPATGGISYSPDWLAVKRRTDCNYDNELLAQDFRGFCATKGIPLDSANIEKVFEGFCRKKGRV